MKSYLHVFDLQEEIESSFSCNKVQPLFQHVFTISKQHWVPGKTLSVKKTMIMS